MRDHIPEIMERAGEKPVVRVLDEPKYLRCLEQKLMEEVEEYLESGELEELADIVEVVCALSAARGGFSKRIFLVGKE